MSLPKSWSDTWAPGTPPTFSLGSACRRSASAGSLRDLASSQNRVAGLPHPRPSPARGEGSKTRITSLVGTALCCALRFFGQPHRSFLGPLALRILVPQPFASLLERVRAAGGFVGAHPGPIDRLR